MVLWMLLFLALAVWNDWRYFRIPNILIVVGAVVTLGICLLKEVALQHMFLGVAIPFVFCIGLFFLGCLGAGDIKLMMVCGIPLGRWVLDLLLWSFLWNGIYAVYFLWKHRSFRLSFQRFLEYISSCISAKRLLPYTKGDGMSRDYHLHFSTGIFLAYLTLLLGGIL